MTVIPYKPEHMQSLLLQPAQEPARPFVSKPEYGRALVMPTSFTAIDGERVLCCGGVVPLWEGRGEAWALMATDLQRDFIRIHHAAKRLFECCGMRRIEAAVDAKHQAAIEWVELLGFRYEGPLRAYTPDGRDCLRYARVKG